MVDTATTPCKALYFCWGLVAALLLTRLVSLGMYPLFDTTEARYGEIARIMLETHNWITPQFDYNVPFWGKPPLHTWITTVSYVWLGVSDFSARLPHFVCGVLTLLVLYHFARMHLGKTKALLSTLVLCSSVGFIVSIGMVMTDPALLLATTVAMVSFWNHYHNGGRFYALMFFAALGAGMLIKGPVAVVLVGIALVLWSVTQGVFMQAIRGLPWVSGMAVCLTICLPWYVWAEIRTPGFLEYFIVGEHIQRFLQPGWGGDLYGTAHDEPKGKIWLFWLAAAFPWSFVLLTFAGKWLFNRLARPKPTTQHQAGSPLTPYLLSWMLAPMLLFTLSGNILSAYVLPGFAAMAMLVAQKIRVSAKANIIGALSLIVLLVALGAYSMGLVSKTSQAQLLGQDRSFPQYAQLFYWQKRPFSARFYSKGQAQLLQEKSQLNQLIADKQSFYLAISHTEFMQYQVKLSAICREQNRTKDNLLLQCY